MHSISLDDPIGQARLIPLLALGLCALATGCQTLEVRSTADPKTDFSRFRTYYFTNTPPLSADPQLTHQNRQRIESAVSDEMARRSCQLEPNPDLLIQIELGTASKAYDKSNPSVDSGSLGSNLSRQYGLLYDEQAGSQSIVNYTEGTLSFRIFETTQNRLVWEGSAVGVLYGNRPDPAVQKRIREAVRAVFARFPIKPSPK